MLTLFGVASVSLMLIAYALEDRAPMFVLLFAGACAASSSYGFLAGAWPFGVVEAVWTAVAIRRWRLRAITYGDLVETADTGVAYAAQREGRRVLPARQGARAQPERLHRTPR